MQFWFKINNESELKNLYFMMKSGFTTNVVGPFLSKGFDLDFMTVFPNITFWDFKTASNDHFSTLESLSLKTTRDQNMKSLIDVSDMSIEFLIKLRSMVNPENICLYDRHYRSNIRFYSLLNLDFHSLLFDSSDKDERIESRNYYMKKSRIGYSVTSDIPKHIRPDFIMTSLEQYERMI